MESKIVKISKECNWSGYTLVISSVSVGNVAQLALDLLLATTSTGSSSGFQKAAYLITPLVEPLVGFDDESSASLNLTCDSK